MTGNKPCPFCGMAVDDDLSDTLYPTQGWVWATLGHRRYRHYVSVLADGLHGKVWTFHCTENSGGCGAEVIGHSRDEALDAWNRRAI